MAELAYLRFGFWLRRTNPVHSYCAWKHSKHHSAEPPTPTYQALDNFQEFLHDHSNALVAQQSADGLEVRGAHEVPVRAIDVAVGNVERLETEVEESE